jgi:hypothetical protein
MEMKLLLSDDDTVLICGAGDKSRARQMAYRRTE